MAAYTTSQAGNWSDTATWGGSGPPGNGDTATVNHAVTVNTNTTVGVSGAAATQAILMTAALTISSGVRLTLRGDLDVGNATLTLASGASLRFDSSVASGTPIYRLRLNYNTSSTSAKLVCNGTGGARCTIDKESGSGVGVITRNNTSSPAAIRATYTDFSDLGTSTAGEGTDALAVLLGATGEAVLEDCTFTRCSRVFVSGANAAANVELRRNRHSAPVGSYSFWLATTAATTGTRVFSNNVCDDPTYKGSSASVAAVWANTVKSWTVTNNVFVLVDLSGISEYSPPTLWQNNAHLVRGGTSSVSIEFGVPGATLLDCYLANDMASGVGDARGVYAPYNGASSGGTVTIDGVIIDSTCPNEDGDFGHYQDPTAAYTLRWLRCLVLPNSRGRSSGAIAGHGNKFVSVEIDHCTLMTADNTSPSSTGRVATWVGSGYYGKAAHINTFRSNLVWAAQAQGSNGGWFGWLDSTYRFTTGTADAGGTTATLVDASPSPAWLTGANVNLAAVGAKLVITGKSGSGPEVGETATITGQAGSTLTFSPAMTAAPDTGTTYRLLVPEVIGTANYNAGFNVRNGTMYDENGVNGTSKFGWEGFSTSNKAAIGANDIDLGTGTYDGTNGPKFVDASRNLFRAYTALWSQAAGTAWDSFAGGDTFAVGDVISNADAAFYANAALQYRCIQSHTKATANSEPGVGSSWRTYWEPASWEYLRDQVQAGSTTTVSGLIGWVRAGAAPTALALRNAGHDGVTPGAVEGVFASSVTAPRPMTCELSGFPSGGHMGLFSL